MGQFLDSAGLASNASNTSIVTDGKKSTTNSTIPISSVMSALTSGGGTRHVSIPCFSSCLSVLLFAHSLGLLTSNKYEQVFLPHLLSGSRNRAANANANSATKESADSNSAPVEDANDVERLDRLSKEIEYFLVRTNH